MIKIILSITILLLSSCTFFSAANFNALKSNKCIELSAASGPNVKSVCMGESAYILRTKNNGKIVDIDIPKLDKNKTEKIFFEMEMINGKQLRVAGNELVFNKKGLCIYAKENKKICVGDKYRSLKDGEERSIIGFSFSTFIDQHLNVFTKKRSDKSLDNSLLEEIDSSIIASKTGIIQDLASCRETSLIKTDGDIIKCAKKVLIKKMDKTCDIFRHGNGRVLADIETKSIQSKCSEKYSFFGASKKTCTAELETKCDKTKELESFIIVLPKKAQDLEVKVKSDTLFF
jgi:hypothetical protein